MNYEGKALTFLDMQMRDLEILIKGRALSKSNLLKSKIITREIMDAAFCEVIREVNRGLPKEKRHA